MPNAHQTPHRGEVAPLFMGFCWGNLLESVFLEHAHTHSARCFSPNLPPPFHLLPSAVHLNEQDFNDDNIAPSKRNRGYRLPYVRKYLSHFPTHIWQFSPFHCLARIWQTRSTNFHIDKLKSFRRNCISFLSVLPVLKYSVQGFTRLE